MQVRCTVTYCLLTNSLQEGYNTNELIWGDNMDIIKVFSSNLKRYRILIGMSQESFAERAGLHRTYISAVERGKRSISLDNIQKIADALGIETYLLFVESENNAEREGIER